MKAGTRLWLVLAVAAALSGMALGPARADDIANASATNVQAGDNENETSQTGRAESGDAVAGSVAGVVSGGDVSIDATNRSEDVDVETGDATGTNNAAAFVGLTAGSTTAIGAADIVNNNAVNVLQGDNSYDLVQEAEAASGDGVGGQVIGVVTTAGGSVDMVAANTTRDAEIETGDATAANDAAAFVGLNATGTPIVAADDIVNASATNVMVGDNELDAAQDADAASGDGVGGQVLGVVSSGRDPIDATNHSEDVDVETGDADATNDFASFVGLTAASVTPISAADDDILNNNATNVLLGDNERELSQSAAATSGDAVAGQVAGVVSSTGAATDLVLANTSLDSSAETGDGTFANRDQSFTGLNAEGTITIF